jgi:hypothetical protein
MKSFLTILTFCISISFSQIPDYVTDGIVYTVTSDSDWVYLGGLFRKVGIHTGRSSAISATDGKSDQTWPLFDNDVNSIISDGNGGYFVAGRFLKVNGILDQYIVHLNSDYSLDENWSYDPNRSSTFNVSKVRHPFCCTFH